MTSLEAAINNLNDKEIPTSLGAQSLVVIINTIRPETVSSSPSHNAARTEFFEVLKKDLRIVDSIFEFLVEGHKKDPTDSHGGVKLMLITIVFISWNVEASTLYVRLMDNGFITKLLQIIPEINEKSFDLAMVILSNLMDCNFQSCGYLERSIYKKGAIFSKLPMLYGIIEKYSFKEGLVINFFLLCSKYLLLEDSHYYKSDVKSHIKDGTIFNVIKMANDLLCGNDGLDDKFVFSVVDSLYHIYLTCVKGTINEREFQSVELRLLNRLAIRKFSEIWKDYSGCTVQNILCLLSEEIKLANPEDIKFYLDNKLYEKLASKCISCFRRKDKIDYPLLRNVIACLNALELITIFDDSIKLRQVRPLIRILPDLVDSKKYFDPTAPDNFFMCRIFLATAILQRELPEEHYHDLKQRNIITLLVENVRKFYKNGDIDIVQMSCTMILLCIAPEHLTCWLSLSEIDQLLPGLPVILEQLSGKSAWKFTQIKIVIELDMLLAQICFWLVSNLLRIKENRKNVSISANLNALKECDFISSLGLAIIRTEDIQTSDWLMQTLYKSCKLFGNDEFMGSLCEILPELHEKQRRCFDQFDETGNPTPKAFQFRCVWLMRKAAAYIIDDLHPNFVSSQIAIQVFGAWLNFRILEGRMFFSSDCQTDKEEFEEKPTMTYESIVDILRGTWWLIKRYPHLVNTELPRCNPLFQSSAIDNDITDLASSYIIGTIKSYLDNSQDKSTEFLIELTTFVKDLCRDSLWAKKREQFFEGLDSACERFMALNKNEVIAANLQFFIDANNGVP